MHEPNTNEINVLKPEEDLPKDALKFFKGTSTLKFSVKVLVPLKYANLRSQFKYSTSDFTGISNPSCIKNARLRLAFSKSTRDLKSR